jgi:nucleoside-diphosphate-sugar epimerase
MRVFVAGATGALGKQLVPMLVAEGHEVVGTTRTEKNFAVIRAAGAEAVTMDGLDPRSVRAAVTAARPEVVIHQLTALAGNLDIRKFERSFALTNRLRTEGTDHLLAAAREVGARRFLAQSYAGWPGARVGGPVKTEADPFDPNPPAQMKSTLDAIRYVEERVVGAGGLALRYGGFYGPGTSLDRDGEQITMIRQRKFPMIGAGTGVWSVVHIRDAARATALAVTRGAPGVYNIVDDDPAEVREWLPFLVRRLGAKPPLRIPAWLARLLVGDHAVSMMNSVRGASNAKARAELGWEPEFPSWRQGFAATL